MASGSKAAGLQQFSKRRKVRNAPINGLPQDGGAGQPTGNLTFSGFQMSISPPLGLHCKSNSHCGCQNCGCHPVVDVKIPTHVRFTKSNSRGLPGPPILGQTIDRCITSFCRSVHISLLLHIITALYVTEI